jgi:hypothetical protein
MMNKTFGLGESPPKALAASTIAIKPVISVRIVVSLIESNSLLH